MSINQFTSLGVLLESLPKTFRDAVRVCRNLDIEYIWIDSLWIIQDDMSDWQMQAAQMAEVYRNTWLTIAASKSKDSREGCFSRLDRTYRGQTLPGYDGIFIRRIPPSLLDLETAQTLEDWPLLLRAWVFQEIRLSRRVVHFGVNEVWWQCRSKLEQQGTSVPGYTQVYTAPLPPTVGGSTLLAQWHLLVGIYSSRKLTLRKDRLPAFAAMAKLTSNARRDDTYMAGLWKSTLILDLGWMAVRLPGELAMDLTHHSDLLPTWSWANLDGQEVDWGAEENEPLSTVRVLEAKCQTDGSPFMGQGLSAEIVLEAGLIPWDTVRQCPFPFDYRTEPKETHQAICEELAGNPYEVVVTQVRWDQPSETYPRSQAEVFVLPLCREPSRHDHPAYLASVRSLIIKRVKCRDKGGDDEEGRRYGQRTYGRMGILELTMAGEWSACSSYEDEQGEDEDNNLSANRGAWWVTLLKFIEGLETHVVSLI